MALPELWKKRAERLCRALADEAARYCGTRVPAIQLEDAVFVEVTDPANGLPAYQATWRNAQGIRCGSLALNSDGSDYGEYDVLVAHPERAHCFVEAVTVWGRDGLLKAEPRLLAAV